MLSLYNYDNFKDLVKKCKFLGLSLKSMNDMECNEMIVTFISDIAEDDVIVEMLIRVNEINDIGIPTYMQVLNINIKPNI